MKIINEFLGFGKPKTLEEIMKRNSQHMNSVFRLINEIKESKRFDLPAPSTLTKNEWLLIRKIQGEYNIIAASKGMDHIRLATVDFADKALGLLGVDFKKGIIVTTNLVARKNKKLIFLTVYKPGDQSQQHVIDTEFINKVGQDRFIKI